MIETYYQVLTPKTPTEDCTSELWLLVQTLFSDAESTRDEIALQPHLIIDQVKYAIWSYSSKIKVWNNSSFVVLKKSS